MMNPNSFGGMMTNPVTWLPTDLGSKLICWLDPNDSATVTLSGSKITNITDKSGTGNDWLEEGGLGPDISTEAINGKDAMLFDGGNLEYLRSFNTNLLVGFAAMVIRPDARLIASADTFVDGDVNTSTNVITLTAHGFTTEDPVYLYSSGTLPAGLAENTLYYVRDDGTNTITLHPTAADATANTNTIDITAAAGGGTHNVANQGGNWADYHGFMTEKDNGSAAKIILIANGTGTLDLFNGGQAGTNLSINSTDTITVPAPGIHETLVITANDPSPATQAILTIGRERANSARIFYGLMGPVIICDEEISAAEKDSVEAYLSSWAGI